MKELLKEIESARIKGNQKIDIALENFLIEMKRIDIQLELMQSDDYYAYMSNAGYWNKTNHPALSQYVIDYWIAQGNEIQIL